MVCRQSSSLKLLNLELHNVETLKKTLTYPGCLLETELEVWVCLEAGDEDAVEGDGGGHGDAGEEGGGQGDGALSHPATARLHYEQHSRL